MPATRIGTRASATLKPRTLALTRLSTDSHIAPFPNLSQHTTYSLANRLPLSAGGHHTCAILNDGGVKCWGSNSHGQLGYDSTDNKGVGPRRGEHSMSKLGTVFLNYTNATAITTGDHHTCALLDGGHVKCWGRAGKGQLGYDCKRAHARGAKLRI